MAPRESRLPVFHQWSGTKGRPWEERPFFLIRDLDTLVKFFARIPFEDHLPHVDFDKTMIFVACPGPTLFDYQPMRVVGFFRNDLRYTVLLDLDRRKTGGYWRNPWVVALLPAIPKGDVDVMRVGDPRRGEPTRVPLFTIWDMTRPRDLPLTPAQPWQAPNTEPPLPTHGFDLRPKPVEYIVVMESPKAAVTSIDKIAQPLPQRPKVLPPLKGPLGPPPRKTIPGQSSLVKTGSTPSTPSGSSASSGASAAPSGTAATSSSGQSPAGGSGSGSGSTPVIPPDSPVASGSGDPLGDAFNLDF
ncbi:MAG: hypothetical protein OZSIB_1476 [Candidatus Ozemobacter sibiricus]|uniref:Uncharacterized protein n=1 Tax=Candidatus Ozemobacter sibiricus TaxID=2268124 RepID=A0A367ZJR6_9BACT|nr:MAG: hypothetical protein OZSIB_1476 [Candidatus Ozemobacter sibiricus]